MGRKTMKKKFLAILSAGLIACSAGLVACGHTCVYDQEVAKESALAQEATCTTQAIYYYSCECGAIGEDMFEYGETLLHSYTAETVKTEALKDAATCTAKAKYYKSCAGCGEISKDDNDVFEAGEKAAHSYTAETVKLTALIAEATCTSPAKYYKSCAGCGLVSTNANDVFTTGEPSHTFTKEEVKPGTFISSATCLSGAKHHKSCVVCGEISTDPNDFFTYGATLDHNYTAKAVVEEALKAPANCTDPAKYYYSCEVCGTISTDDNDVFENGKPAHYYTKETIKPEALKSAASCVSPTTYYKSCVCGLVSTNANEVFALNDKGEHNYDANTGVCANDCGCVEIEKARVGAEANTLYFFDKANGYEQVTVSDAIASYSKEVKLNGEAGSLALTFDNNKNITSFKWDTFGYEFNEGDYVVFYVYNDSNADAVDISLGYTHRQRCYNGQWTMVVWSAADVETALKDYIRLYARNWAESDWIPLTDVNLDGTIYLSKAKVYSASQVQDLTKIGDTDEYTIGNATLIGAPTITNGNYNANDAAFNDDFFKNAYCVNGVFALNTNGKTRATGEQAQEQVIDMTFKFKEGYQITSNTYLYITVKGLDLISLDTQAFSSAGINKTGHFATFKVIDNNISLYETLADGSQVYKLDLANYAGKTTDLTYIRIMGYKLKFPVTGQVVISDITVANS